ncbi:MAG TPA: Rrf2 family transcriptional regulator [Candidatus Eisenbergiella merdipullorum]|uniref:Rrf2 family transcriptional regulator n=1 Tax=Candidatus Eisenbergiella merdipullorum TaxID=2838553 RepID=A0A9D2I3I2_9FIRM|nr:Rrf2 family transcriptional regulator [Candidatus Eisenbergiella merdipullorum]
MHISTKCSVAIHCLIFIHEYGDKTKVTSELLSRSTGINPVTIRNILSSLKKDGILSVKLGTGGATLDCPLKEVSLYRVCMALEPDFLSRLIGVHPTPSELCPVGRNIHSVLDCSYEKIKDDLKNSLEGITLENVVSDYHSFQPEACLPAAGTTDIG